VARAEIFLREETKWIGASVAGGFNRTTGRIESITRLTWQIRRALETAHGGIPRRSQRRTRVEHAFARMVVVVLAISAN